MSDQEKSVSSTEAERNEWLHRLWVAHVKKMIEKIENTPAAELEAATLTAARQLLSDNGITTDSLKDASRQAHAGLEATLRAIRAMEELEQDEFNLPPANPE